MKVYIVKSWIRREPRIEFVFSTKENARQYKKLRDREIRMLKIENLAFDVEEFEVIEELPMQSLGCDL